MTLISCDGQTSCRERILAMRDTIEVLGGKWKIAILHSLSFGTQRFTDLQETLVGITPKVLAKELLDLEQNLLVTRTVNDTRPVTVSYTLTPHAYEAQPVIEALLTFGAKHRRKVIGK